MKTYSIARLGVLAALVLSWATVTSYSQEVRPGPPPGPESPRKDGAPMSAHEARIRKLHAAGKHEKANRLVERLRKAGMKHNSRPANLRPETARAPKPEPPHEYARPQHHGPPPVMKIRNLKQAADLLEAAGYRDHAAKARQEAGSIETEMRREAEEAKRREMVKRQTESDRKRDEGKQRAREDEEMRAEMQKLRREVQELRGQLRKANEEAAKRTKPQRRSEN